MIAAAEPKPVTPVIPAKVTPTADEQAAWLAGPVATATATDADGAHVTTAIAAQALFQPIGRYGPGIAKAFGIVQHMASTNPYPGMAVGVFQARSGEVFLCNLKTLPGHDAVASNNFDLAKLGLLTVDTFSALTRGLLGIAGNGTVVHFTPTGLPRFQTYGTNQPQIVPGTTPLPGT